MKAGTPRGPRPQVEENHVSMTNLGSIRSSIVIVSWIDEIWGLGREYP